MKIRRIVLDEVIVPARPDSVNSLDYDKPLHMLSHGGKAPWSVQFDQIPKLIIQIEMDSGIIGIGEFYRGVSIAVVMELAQGLIHLKVTDFNFQSLPLPSGRIYDGFETALLDGIGKERGLSLNALLGGSYRDHIYCGYWTGHRSVEDSARKAKEGKQKGFDCIKFKCTHEDPVIEWCQAIYDACGPDFKIILDSNQRFENLAIARRIADELAKIGNVICLEDPIARWDLESLALLRQVISIPVALHVALPYQEMGYQHPTDALRALRLEACDYFNFNGGSFPVKRLSTLAEISGKPFWHGSEIDLGILEAAYIHRCSACAGATMPSDIFGELVRENDLIKQPIEFKGSLALVPPGPGLGVDLDSDALEHFRSAKRIAFE